MSTPYTKFVKEHISIMPQKSPQDRMKAVAKLWKSSSMKGRSSLTEVLVDYLNENYDEYNGMMTTKTIRFKDTDGRKISIQLKWFKMKGELIIKEISIQPPGGNILTTAIEDLVHSPETEVWGLNAVVLEAILSKVLFQKLQERGWQSKPGIWNNLYFFKPGFTEIEFDDLL